MHFVGVDATTLPASASSRQVAEALDAGGRPRALRARSPRSRDAPPEQAVTAELAAAPGAAAVLPARRGGAGPLAARHPARATRVSPTSSQQLVHTVRAKLPDARVTGQTAAFVDQQASLAAHLPWALAILALTTCTLIFLFTGSVVLPLKSLDHERPHARRRVRDPRRSCSSGAGGSRGLESTQPILLCATAFGLSTDYAIFLFSRIKEARDRGLENRDAVADGMERTGRVVTAAALLFCVAIGTFATSGISFIQELGVGTAVAVALDATIIRALLVPSLMALLGDWNWWAPEPLRRLHLRLTS